MNEYRTLVEHYENKLNEFGPNYRGMDWPNEKDLLTRFRVLTSIVPKSQKVSILDLGCGVGLLVDYLYTEKLLDRSTYLGVDLSSKMISAAKHRHPDQQFLVQDLLVEPLPEESVDYAIMNGLLTEKRDLSQSKMKQFAKEILSSVFKSCKFGMAFNVMSPHVDWKRDDLFHWELDDAVSFLRQNCSGNIRVMLDYGLFEYTVHVTREPR
ncbi:MAG: class I SAM-dependent methyltransferase [Pseudomonadales bacterium]|nr:class I SAM-dependent methyltransferase [Pseudomonadales bacterium]MBO6596165.1 class I SAM-dependent methyltransferase [Pseudomonadales bacterium]MBO6822645.1 class I SAM-dependent methyltransferase [Pseudomonadales bacterium]